MRAPKILFPTDFSPSARLRLAEAVALAKAWRSTLLILHVQESKTAVDWARRHDRLEPSFELVERMLNELATNDPAVPVLYRFSIGDPATEIVRMADQERVELIVMGGKRRGRFLTLTTGSVSDTVVRRAKCPVVVYNAPGAEVSNGSRAKMSRQVVAFMATLLNENRFRSPNFRQTRVHELHPDG